MMVQKFYVCQKKNENIYNYNFAFRCKFSILVTIDFIVGGGFCVGVMMGIDSRKKKVLIMYTVFIILQEADEALERIINEKVEEKRNMAANNRDSKSDQLDLFIETKKYKKNHNPLIH